MPTATAADAALAHRAAWLRGASLGLLAWVIGLFALRLDWAPALVVLGALVVVPLGLALLDDLGPVLRRFRWQAVLPWLHLLCAGALLVSFPAYPGWRPGLLAVPWLGFTAVVALLGFLRLVTHGYRTAAGIATSAGLMFLAVGGGWVLASRWGIEPMGFREPIVLLTGAHFHYAGFALPILTGLAAGVRPSVRARLAVAGVVLGVPLVAAGITVGRSVPVVELAAAWFLALASLLVVGLQGEMAARALSRPERLLFGLSGLALLAGMVLAALYALGTFLAAYWLTIPQMIPWHGTLNALGFALPALLAWHLRRQHGSELQIIVRALGGRPDLDLWEKRPLWPGIENGPGAGDRRDVHEREVGAEAPGAPEPDGAHRRAAAAILCYDIFPPNLVRPVLRRRPVQVGDTVGICYHQAPGIDLFLAARVVACFDEPSGGAWRTGFTYRTLVGHPEYGEETFSVEKDLATGRVIVALRSWSRPGTLLALVFAPWVRWQQLRAGRAAVEHLARLAAAQGSSGE
jgi:uncharacterized protein (UPF0548 family)